MRLRNINSLVGLVLGVFLMLGFLSGDSHARPWEDHSFTTASHVVSTAVTIAQAQIAMDVVQTVERSAMQTLPALTSNRFTVGGPLSPRSIAQFIRKSDIRYKLIGYKMRKSLLRRLRV